MNYLSSEPDRDTLFPGLLDQLKIEVNEFFSSFEDSPEHISQWGHHYFCTDEGGPLQYDPGDPHNHRCSICGKVHSNSLLNGVWWTMYRNSGVTNAWKSALLYRESGNDKYLRNVVLFADFYSDNYGQFRLHNKEGIESDSLNKAPWGSSRIMPQALNESIFIIRLINALELVKNDLPKDFVEKLSEGIFANIYKMFRPQVRAIHNISNWLECGIAVMGLFTANQEMVDFAFDGEFGINNQLAKGVAEDFLWYEGSIHYNMFLLEGVVNVMLFSELYGRDFSFGKKVVEKMLLAVYEYAFDNHRLPNPNDGWPDINLKTYSYIFAVAVKVLGKESRVGRVLGSILNREGERGILPLSKPWFFQNDASLEEYLFVPRLRREKQEVIRTGSVNFSSSHCALLKAHGSNLFIKYGHNGPSHAHPDKMNVEVILKDLLLSRDLSNAGYGNQFCNEWHRVSASHNTVVVNGENHSSFTGGDCLVEEADRLKVEARGVYPGVNFQRDVRITNEGFSDLFDVDAPKESIFDYFFHVDGKLVGSHSSEKTDLDFNKNGYQHLLDIKRIDTDGRLLEMEWQVDGGKIRSSIDTADGKVFVMESPDNPVVLHRSTMVVRKRGIRARFMVNWEVI